LSHLFETGIHDCRVYGIAAGLAILCICERIIEPVMSESDTQRPILSRTIRPKVDSDQQRLLRALSDIAQQDPAVRVETQDDQTILSGKDESHLESLCDRILHRYKIGIDLGEPRVIYLETVRKRAEAEGKYIRRTGGLGHYAHVRLRVEPNEPGRGFEFINQIQGGVVPKEYIKPIELGIREAMQGGVLAGHELVDLKVALFDGSFHELDSNEVAFQIAGAMALKEAARRATPVVLEPVMAAEITVREEFLGTFIGDLNSRRGRIEGISNHEGSVLIRALVPLSEILRSSTQRWPVYSVHFARYEQAPFRNWGEPGADGAGITANKPNRPKTGRGSAAVNLDAES
jgi:elongation factor G